MDPKHAQDLTEKYHALLNDLIPALREYVTKAIRSKGVAVDGSEADSRWAARVILTAALEDYGDQYTPRDSARRKTFLRDATNVLASTPRP